MKLQNVKVKITFIILILVSVISLLTILFMKSHLFRVDLSTVESHLEIGTKANTSPEYYLSGNNWCIPLSYVDTSSVKHTQVGRYPVYIYHGFQKFTSYVNVTDTTPPSVNCNIKNKTIEPGEIISIKSLGLNVSDYSEIEYLKFTKISSTKFNSDLPAAESLIIQDAYRNGIAIEAEEFQFAYGGIYQLTICAQDSFYNKTELELTITVEEPPSINVKNDFYVADIKEIDFAEYIIVSDFISGEINVENVTIDTSQLKLSTPGTYPVTLSVTDDYGLTAEKTIKVHVSSKENLQELVNSHRIDLTTSVVLGTKNSYDIGYFEEDNIIAVQQAMLPCFVHIRNDVVASFGSGFIIEITNEFITLVTNQHVIDNDLIVDITFYNGKRYHGSVVASNGELDIAFIRIPIDGNSEDSSISSADVQQLRTVHINKGYWDNLADDCGLMIAYNCINENGEIWNNNIGYIVEKEAIRDWNQYKDINETIVSFPATPGSSGSALFDGHGQLVGMVRGYTNYDSYTESVAVPLIEILNYFEAVFKYKIHYQ